MDIDLNYSTLITAILVSIFASLILKTSIIFLMYIRKISMILSLKRINSLSFIDNHNKLLLKDGKYYEILFKIQSFIIFI